MDIEIKYIPDGKIKPGGHEETIRMMIKDGDPL